VSDQLHAMAVLPRRKRPDISIGYVSEIIWIIWSEFKPDPTGSNFTDKSRSSIYY
jgi:hypothetical protein